MLPKFWRIHQRLCNLSTKSSITGLFLTIILIMQVYLHIHNCNPTVRLRQIFRCNERSFSRFRTDRPRSRMHGNLGIEKVMIRNCKHSQSHIAENRPRATILSVLKHGNYASLLRTSKHSFGSQS